MHHDLVFATEAHVDQLARLHLVEALSVVGVLATETFKRLPEELRMENLHAWKQMLTERVRDTLG